MLSYSGVLLTPTFIRYYNQDEEAGRSVAKTLATLPPSQRPPFARLQASVRSGYHAHVTARRNAEYRAHLSVTLPGGSLSAHSRLHPNGPAARKERYEHFDTFLRNWCALAMPGARPFFEALWAVMRLQTLPENLGGAGSRRITWEIDDAVFQEAAYVDCFNYVPFRSQLTGPVAILQWQGVYVGGYKCSQRGGLVSHGYTLVRVI